MQEVDHLARLPAELRLQIFTYALSSPYALRHVRLGDSQSGKKNIGALLLTSRYIVKEARNLFYDLNTFKLTPLELECFSNPQDFSRIREIRIIRSGREDGARGLRGLGQRVIALVKAQKVQSPTRSLRLQWVIIEEAEALTLGYLFDLRTGTQYGTCKDIGIAQWRLRLACPQEQPYELLVEHPPLRRLWDHITTHHPPGSANDLSTFLRTPQLTGTHINPLTEAVMTAVLDHKIHTDLFVSFPDCWPSWIVDRGIEEGREVNRVDITEIELLLEQGRELDGDAKCLRDWETIAGGQDSGLGSRARRKRLEWVNDVLIRTWDAMERSEDDGDRL